jgi:hypothetical protein
MKTALSSILLIALAVVTSCKYIEPTNRSELVPNYAMYAINSQWWTVDCGFTGEISVEPNATFRFRDAEGNF